MCGEECGFVVIVGVPSPREFHALASEVVLDESFHFLGQRLHIVG